MKAFRYVLLIGIVVSSFACKSEKKQVDADTSSGAILENFADYLTSEDTIAVTQLVTQFLENIKVGKYYDAASMLYKANPENEWKQPLLLDNDELQQIVKMLKNFPIGNYSIEYMHFNTAVNNDVKCSMIHSNNVNRNLHLNPINYLGGWHLSLKTGQ